MRHIPVMVNEVLEYLDIHEGMTVIDATAGAGGHTAALMEQVGEHGRVCAIDSDSDAVRWLESRFAREGAIGKLTIVHGNFRFLTKIIQERFLTPIDRIFFDLGPSFDQLTDQGRGFSFFDKESFDMRFSKGKIGPYGVLRPTAAEVVHTISARELERIFHTYGDDPDASLHARALVEARTRESILSSEACAQILWRATPRARRAKGPGSTHPATQAMQALRIYVNDEYENVRQGLISAREVLAPRGRCAVITFHSGEDRIVKHLFRRWDHEGHGELLTPKGVGGSNAEQHLNPRARSATLRVFEKK